MTNAEVAAWLAKAAKRPGTWDVVDHGNGVSIIHRGPDGENDALTFHAVDTFGIVGQVEIINEPGE